MRSSASVDTHDLVPLRSAMLRTRVSRVVLVLAAVVLLALATSSARGLNVSEQRLLPTGSTGVVVLDLSLSIAGRDYADMSRALRRIIADGRPTGLVIFSDVPYELLPPGTPASELRPFLRLLKERGNRLPVNPWMNNFRQGTKISSALQLAGDSLARDHVKNGSILLISDLETAPDDIPVMTRTIQELRKRSVTIRVVPISALSTGRTIYEGLLGSSAFVEPSKIRAPEAARTETRVELPTGLLVFGAILFVVLALHERFAGVLGLPSARPRTHR